MTEDDKTTEPKLPVSQQGLLEEPYVVDQILRYFTFEHLPPGPLRNASRPFCELAQGLTDPGSLFYVPRSAERTVALRKLLEAKDAAVRAALP